MCGSPVLVVDLAVATSINKITTMEWNYSFVVNYFSHFEHLSILDPPLYNEAMKSGYLVIYLDIIWIHLYILRKIYNSLPTIRYKAYNFEYYS